MSRISDSDLNAGLRTRRKITEIDEGVRTITTQMHADALRVPLGLIKPSPYQVRTIDEQALEDLMASIVDTNGLITPVVLRPIGNEEFELVAGHTRYLACKKLGYPDISAVVRPMTDSDAAKALAADNLTRKDLSDYEIFKQLAGLFELGFIKSNSEAARLLGRNRQDIIRYLSYGKLPEAVIEMLEIDRYLLGASAASDISGYPESEVIEGCQRLASGKLKTQQALISWLARQAVEPPSKVEQRVLDADGKTVGRVTSTSLSLKIAIKNADMDELNKAIQRELERQGFRF